MPKVRIAHRWMTALQRFWAQVNKYGPIHAMKGQCWQWMGKPACVYGQLTVNGKTVQAHRYSWEIHNGLIPANIQVLHKCDNPLCVNPSHLFLGSQSDNVQDCLRKGRHRKGDSRGEANGMAVLTKEKVLEIRKRYKKHARVGKNSAYALTVEFGISVSHVGQIVRKERWRNV